MSMPECVFQGSLKQFFVECGKKKVMRFDLGDPWVKMEKKKKNAKASTKSSD